MHIYSAADPQFKPYGRIVTGLEDAAKEICRVLETTPLPEGVGYVPEEAALQALPAAALVRDHLFGGMPCQLGWCNGHNSRLNCLEYHRDSEFNLGTLDFILLLARQEEIVDGILDTGKVKAFRVPRRGFGGGLRHQPFQYNRLYILAKQAMLVTVPKQSAMRNHGDSHLQAPFRISFHSIIRHLLPACNCCTAFFRQAADNHPQAS